MNRASRPYPETGFSGDELRSSIGNRRGFVTTSARRASRKILNELESVCERFRKLLIRAVFALPLFSKRDPRRKIVRCRDFSACRPVPSGHCLEDWLISVVPAVRTDRKPPISLNEDQSSKFQESSLRYQGGFSFQIPEIFLVCVHNAYVYSNDLLVLTHDRQIVFESALCKAEVLERNGILDRLSRPRQRRVSGDFCLLSTPWSAQYYHWLMDALPRLSLLEQFPELQAMRLIVQQRLLGYQRETLEELGVSSQRVIPFDGECWQVDRLFFPEILSPTGNPSPTAVRWLRRQFMDESALNRVKGRRRIYITRRDAAQRRIVNEQEIIEYLYTLGFEVICPGDLSFKEQVELFGDVDVVVAAHGGGCTNMVFAPVNAILVELFGDNYINGCFWALTNIIGQSYAFLTGAPVERLDYAISVADLKVLLKQVIVSY
jgi:capsular polysaccharide biosynthesis protein